MKENISFIGGKNIYLSPFTSELITSDYLSWLNDSEVNKFSRRIFGPTNDIDAKKFLSNLGSDEYILAIFLKKTGRHVGNIQFGPVNWKDSYAEIRIIVGDRSVWGKGVGTEAIHIVTKHIFDVLGLNRVEANSCNPSFMRCVEKLGWKKEGALRERFSVGGKMMDYLWFSILNREYASLQKKGFYKFLD